MGPVQVCLVIGKHINIGDNPAWLCIFDFITQINRDSLKFLLRHCANKN